MGSMAVDVGENIRRLREKANLTQRELAKRAGLSSVKMIETGQRLGRHETLGKIAGALGVPVSVLFEDSPEASE